MASIIPPNAATAHVLDEPLYEIINGQRVELPPMSAYEVGLANLLSFFLNSFAFKDLGIAVVEMLFDFPSCSRQRRPDVAFVRYDRFAKGRRIPRKNAWEIVPNLAVEVISRTNGFEEISEKIDDYFRVGVSLVWVIMPEQELIHVYTSLKSICVLDRTDVLDGGTVIPGFKLPLIDLFPSDVE